MLICTVKCKGRRGEGRGGCHGLGVKAEFSQGVGEHHIQTAGEEGSREENKWGSGRCCRGPWMEVFFSESEIALPMLRVRDCSEIELHEPKLPRGHIQHGAQPIVNWR